MDNRKEMPYFIMQRELYEMRHLFFVLELSYSGSCGQILRGEAVNAVHQVQVEAAWAFFRIDVVDFFGGNAQEQAG